MAMFKRICAFLIIAAAALFVVGKPAAADTEVSTWEELSQALASGGIVVLADNVEGGTQLSVPQGDSVLYLEGYTVTYTGTEPLFNIAGMLEICDSSINCGKVIMPHSGIALKVGNGDFNIEKGAFNVDPSDYVVPNIVEEDQNKNKDDIIKQKEDGLWYVRENYRSYEPELSPSPLILTLGGEAGVIKTALLNPDGTPIDKSKYEIKSVDLVADDEEQNDETAQSGNTGGDAQEGTVVQNVCSWQINNTDRTITVTPIGSGIVTLRVTFKLTDTSDAATGTEYSDDIQVGVQAAGYTFSLSPATVWTRPNVPVKATAELRDANGAVVATDSYTLAVENDMADDEDTQITISGNEITVTQTGDFDKEAMIFAMSQDGGLYSAATLTIRPESARPSSGSSGGCNYGFGALALLALPLILKRRK